MNSKRIIRTISKRSGRRPRARVSSRLRASTTVERLAKLTPVEKPH